MSWPLIPPEHSFLHRPSPVPPFPEPRPPVAADGPTGTCLCTSNSAFPSAFCCVRICWPPFDRAMRSEQDDCVPYGRGYWNSERPRRAAAPGTTHTSRAIAERLASERTGSLSAPHGEGSGTARGHGGPRLPGLQSPDGNVRGGWGREAVDRDGGGGGAGGAVPGRARVLRLPRTGRAVA